MMFKYKSIINYFICIFPLANQILYLIFDGGYTSVFYIFSAFILLILAIKTYKIKTKDFFLIAIMIYISVISLLVHEYIAELPILVEYIFFVATAFVLNNEKFKAELLSFLYRNEKMVLLINYLYIIIISLTVVFGKGLLIGWGTITLTGPYGTPHMLAYESISLLSLNMIFLMNRMKLKHIILIIIYSVIILLSASRVALIGLFVIFFVFLQKLNISKKILIVVSLSFLMTYLFLYTDILNPLIEKTTLAINNGSISNGRLEIFESSLKTFFDFDKNWKWFVGIGYKELMEGNDRLIHYAIQGHNDIINAFICTGPVFCVIFLYSVFRISKGQRGSFFKFLLLMCLINLNGLVSYFSFSVTTMIVLILFEFEDKERNKVRKRETLMYEYADTSMVKER